MAIAEWLGDEFGCAVLVATNGKDETFISRIASSACSMVRRDAKLKEEDFKIVELAGPAAVKAFQTGQIEGYYTIDPNMADVVEKTGARQTTRSSAAPTTG